MKVTATYTYIADTVIEVVTTVDGADIKTQVNVLPITDNVRPMSDNALPDVSQTGNAPVAGNTPAQESPQLPPSVETPAPLPNVIVPPAPLPLMGAAVCAPAPPPTKKKRALMGVIRASKTLIFTVGGEALVYLTNNLTSLNLPPGLGLAVGAAAYGVQKALKPEGLL